MSELRLGLDIGSTTVKFVLLEGDRPVWQVYRRHYADAYAEVARMLAEAADRYPGVEVVCSVTGSAGLGLAQRLDLPFVQEVVAGTRAVSHLVPEADVVIELGGEDAKITYLKPMPEQRMNGTCAGGTGAFIDQMATLLHTDVEGLDALAGRYEHLHRIASRCGVFAKSDLQPLINEGARPEDLAASIFQAVATQAIAGLAQGRPIRGTVVFLGGPLHFLSQLRAAFVRALEGSVSDFVLPDDAQLVVARGAAFAASGEARDLAELAVRAHDARPEGVDAQMPPLFADDKARAEFDERHARATIPQVDVEQARGRCYLGIDAGSTTIKAVVVDDDERIVWSHYALNRGDPVGAAADILRRIRQALPESAVLARACATGYGEGLVRAALHVDDGEVETVAHYRAAEHVARGVTSVIDIGGQDMKYLRVHDGAIDSIAVNEACSSGCGSFLQTFAETMELSLKRFTDAAIASFAPVDLGSRCTVFMNSSVKQAQKQGATVGDISAGLSYAVVRNALFKVIKLRDVSELGDTVVVQGGTFLNDAVLRAFELLTGVEVIRPNLAGLMGAFGAALIARSNSVPGRDSTVLSVDEIERLEVETSQITCQLCQNHCRCTVSVFNDGQRYVSGNRCERGGDATKAKSDLPNLVDYTYKRLFAYRRLLATKATRGDIGIPRALNMYENYPLWFTTLTALGFRVVVSKRSSHETLEMGMESITSENVCYPAKLVHGHVVDLVNRGVTTIFFPSVSYEAELVEGADNRYNCPVVAGYPEVIANNVEQLRDNDVRFLHPYLNLANRRVLARRLAEVFAEDGVTEKEAAAALELGFAEDARVKADIRAEGQRALEYLRTTGTRGIVLAGRPYHVDPEVHHGIPELITGLGMAVLTEASVLGTPEAGRLERPLMVRDQWAYHSRLYAAADVVARRADLQLVQLTSFGCGLDAITSDQVADILAGRDDIYTSVKIDEVSNLGAARIRLRSLDAAARERAAQGRGKASDEHARDHAVRRVPFTRRMRAKHTLIAPQMSPLHFRFIEAALRRSGYRVEILETVGPRDVDTGLTYVNNDACYPAILVVGQLVEAFKSGRYDPENTSVLISQTGGMCRATNYAGLLRRGLRDAGFGRVPVVTMSVRGIEKNPGFSRTPALVHHLTQAVVLGDLLQDVLLRVRPYEAEHGAAMRLYRRWDGILREYLERGRRMVFRRGGGYRRLISALVEEFDALPLRPGPRLPRVGVVGEILVKFHPDANNHLVDVLEAEGCEVAVPGLTEFVLTGMYSAEWNHANLGTDTHFRWGKAALRRMAEAYRDPVRRALAATGGKFAVPGDLAQMAKGASEILSLGNQFGEGWLLTAEILELIEDGVTTIVCAQPFACLPNHVTGKGMFGAIRRLHPEANITTIEYDPGASQVNQLNRVKLLLSATEAVPTGTPDPRPETARSGEIA